ncbi:MAG: Rieske (2Fe-2S) protein [Sphingomonas bacterium]|nr:Rieske (2Fe-2S) protein [Sphingomonas bacterium]
MFVTNQWYVIAYARDIGPEPFSRTVCGERILVYRKQDGSVTAMRDACPHRLLPLSMGIKEGDNIRCRYHGLVLDTDGRAVEMPIKSDPVNRSICAAKYPVVERYQFIWVWIGEPAKADPALVPDYWMCEDPGWVFDGGSYHVRCNYQLLVDNLMDLTHETYVHEGSIGQPELMQSPITSRVEGDRVIVERWMHDVPPAPAYRTSPDQENVDRWQICHFLPPSSVIIDVGVAPVSEGWSLENHPVRSFVIDAITPETETTSWYYWGAARGVDIGNAERTARTKMLQGKVFAEDIAVLEAQQQSIEDNPDLKLRAFNIDAGGVRSRTIIRKMAQRDGAAAAMDASDAEQELA